MKNQDSPELAVFKPFDSSNYHPPRSQSPKIRQLSRSKAPLATIFNKSNISISALNTQYTLNTQASETEAPKETHQSNKLSTLLKKQVFRPVSSLKLLSRKKERPRPIFTLFRDPPKKINESVIIRSLITGKIGVNPTSMSFLQGHNSKSLMKDSSSHHLQNSAVVQRTSAETNARSKSADKNTSSISNFGSNLEQSVTQICQSDSKINNKNMDLSEILHSHPVILMTSSRKDKTPSNRSSVGKSHIAYRIKRREPSSRISLSISQETSAEFSSKGKSKYRIESLKERILEDLDANQGDHRVHIEGPREVQMDPLVGNIRLSALVDKATLKRAKSAASLKSRKLASMLDIDSEIGDKDKKPAPIKVKVKTWIEKLPKFNNLLKPSTPENILEESNIVKEASNSPGTKSKNYRLLPWDELVKPMNGNDEEKENIRKEVEAKVLMWRKMRKRQKTRNFKQIKKSIIEALNLIRKLNLSLDEVVEKKAFPKTPYEKDGSKEFIQAVKMNDMQKVKEMLQLDPYLVYQYDHIYQTPLHWACKRALKEIAELLIRAKSNLNAQDMVGRTPLYYAITNDNLELVRLMLYNKCDPWSNNKVNYTKLVRKKPYMRYYLSHARKTHIVMKMVPLSKRHAIWDRQAYFLLQSPKRLPKFEDGEDSD